MEQDLWRRAEHVFHAALECAPESRRAFLNDACGYEPELRTLVETLLCHDERAGSFLEQPVITDIASAAAPKGALIGREHGPYRFISLLGAGGMGEVYRARDEKLGREVAIKTLPSEFSRDPLRLARLRREARALAALNHPNISAIHGLEESEDLTYLVLELVEGATPSGPLPRTTALHLASQLAEALEVAHAHGIVHRDLKPANLKVTPDGRLKILDFGLATGMLNETGAVPSGASESRRILGSTVVGLVQGTPGYMSPEQARGEEVDQRTDIWAFGCILYELLVGNGPFSGESALDANKSILEEEPDWTAVPAGTPAPIEHLLRHCLQKDPNLRLDNIASALSAIREAQQQLGSDASHDGAVVSRLETATALEGNRGSRVTLLIAAAVLMMLGVGATTLVLRRLPPPSPSPAHFALAMPGGTALGFSVSSSVAVAADGSGVVYLGTSGGRRQLYWHDLQGPESWPLAGTEGVEGSSTPFLSPDANWLGFFRDGSILKVPLRAGRVPKGTHVTQVASAHSLRGAVWSADGAIIYGTIRSGLWEVSAEGRGTPRRLTEPDVSNGEGDHRWPALLPGGRDVLFTIEHLSGRGDRAVLAVFSRDTGQVRRIHQGGRYGRYLPSGHLIFGSEGTLMAAPFDLKTHRLSGLGTPVLSDVSFGVTTSTFAFDVTQDGTLVYASETAVPHSNELVWVSRDGEVQMAVPGRRAYDPSNLALAPDGTRVATGVTGRPYLSLWVWNLSDGTGARVPVDADCGASTWSPDGERLAFSSNRDGAFNLYSIATGDREAPQRIGESTMMQRPRSWSPDGRFLAYEVQTPTRPLETHIVEIGRGLSWRWGPEGADVSEPAFSPDGRWMAYQSRESGRWEVWVRPFAGGGPRHQVSGPEGGLAPVWVGKEIYYIERPNDTRIMSRRVESMAPLRLAPSPTTAFALPFALASDNPFFSLAYAVAPGGRRVLVVRRDRQAPEAINSLNVITNWSERVSETFLAAPTR